MSAHSRENDSVPISICPSDNELTNGQLGSRNLELAVKALHDDGLVIIEDVFNHDHLDHLNKAMVEDAYTLQARKDASPFNYNKGNIQQEPPPTKEHFNKDLFMNSIVTQVTSTCLGPRPKMTFLSANTALPPTADCPPQSQPIHSDADFSHPSHAFALVVNIPLVTFTPENGSTEIWLATHTNTGLHDQDGAHGDRASGRIKPHLLEARRARRPPCQPVVKKGSVIIRDLRLWHGGRGNFTNEPRVMVAMIHFAPWYRNQMKLELAEEIKDKISAQDALEIPVEWVGEDVAKERHLNRGYGNSYDFTQSA